MKIKTTKLLAVLCTVVMLVTTIIPSLAFTASAADTTITFDLGSNGSASHNDGSSATTYSQTVDGYKLSITNGTKMYTGARDAEGNSAIKLGTSSAVGGFKFTVPNDVTSVIIYIAKYKSNTTKINVNGTAHTLTKNSNNGEYDAITVNTTTTKTVTLTTVSGGARAMVNTIEYVIPAAEDACKHTNTTDNIVTEADCINKGSKTVTCLDCDDYSITEEIPALGHAYGEYTILEDATCAEPGYKEATCERCGEKDTQTIPALTHNYVDNKCTICGAEAPLEATITFDDKSKRTEFTDDKQVWEENGIIVTNKKDKSTTKVGDYANPLRVYKSSQLIISAPGVIITELIIAGDGGSDYITPIKNSLENAGYTVTVNGNNYIIYPNSETVTFSASAQIRIASIKIGYHVHEYTEDTTPPTVDADGYTTYTCKCGHSYVETNEGSQLKAVAKIGEQGYASLQDAIDAANAGDTITLLDNINAGVKINKAITLDGEGFTITGTVTVEGHSDVVETVKFVNVKFFIDADIFNNTGITAGNYTEIFFENCDFTTNSDDRYHNGSKAIVVAGSDCTVEVKNCTASKLYCMINANNALDTNITVDGSTMTEMFYGICSYRCAATIKNTTYEGYYYGICGQNSDTTLALENVTITASHSKAVMMAAPVGSNGGTYIISLTGDNYANGAEMLAKADSVWLERENAEDSYQIKHIGHTATSTVEENRKEPTCTTEGSYDKVYYCSNCGVIIGRETLSIPAKGHSYDEGVVTAPTYDAQGYTTYTCGTCGDVKVDNYTNKLEKIVISKSCIVLKEAININFLISESILVDGRDYVAVIKKGDTVVAEIPYSEWTANGSYKVITYTGIVAKQMADLYTVVIYDGELQVSDERIDGVTEYVKRAIAAGVFANPDNAELATLLVDMLNYGTAAQLQWNYNTDNLANAIVADYQSFATKTDVTFAEDTAVKASENYGSTTVSLKDRVILNFNFKEGTLDNAAKAIISYTDHYGIEVSYEIAAEDFVASAGRIIIAVDKLVAADARCIVTCTFVDANGDAIEGVYAQDSIANYCARAIKYYGAGTADANIYESIMKYSDAATKYFSK